MSSIYQFLSPMNDIETVTYCSISLPSEPPTSSIRDVSQIYKCLLVISISVKYILCIVYMFILYFYSLKLSLK